MLRTNKRLRNDETLLPQKQQKQELSSTATWRQATRSLARWFPTKKLKSKTRLRRQKQKQEQEVKVKSLKLNEKFYITGTTAVVKQPQLMRVIRKIFIEICRVEINDFATAHC